MIFPDGSISFYSSLFKKSVFFMLDFPEKTSYNEVNHLLM